MADFRKLGKGVTGALTKASEAANAKMGTQEILPAAERDANLAKMLDSSAVKERMYHGSGAEIIDAFKPNSWWTDDSQYASRMARQQKSGSASNVTPAYLSLNKIARLKDLRSARETLPLGVPDNEVFKVLSDAGFDGLSTMGGTKEIIVFNPSKIKSATGNRGTYDITDPDISKAKGGVLHMADAGKVVRGGLKAIQAASKAADEQLAAGKLKAALEAQQAPMTRPQGTGLPLMPRDNGMYTLREQKDLPRMPKVDAARAAGVQPKYNERMQDLLDSPKARKKVDNLINKGKDLNVQEWYGTEPLRQVALDAGRTPEQFESLMAQLASASQRNPVDKQNQMGSYLYYLSETGQLPENSLLLTNKLKKALKDDPSLAQGRQLVELPTGYGSLAQGDIFNRAVMIGQGDIAGALPPNKKLGTFYENLLGNVKPVTVDVNALRGPIIEQGDPRWLTSKLVEKDETGKITNSYKPREMYDSGEMSMREAQQRPGFWEAAPSGSEYAGFEELWQRGAKRHNIEPAEAQALGWYGSADVTALKTKPENYVDNLERLIKRTAEQTGKSPSEVMNDMVTGKGFLRKEGGAVDRKEDMSMKMADLRLRSMVNERMGMAKGGRVSIFDAPAKRMASGGKASIFDKPVHMVDGGKIGRGVMGAVNKASRMADEKIAADAMKKAAESAGMKSPVTTNKPVMESNSAKLSREVGTPTGIKHLSFEDYTPSEVELVNLEAIEQGRGYGSSAMNKIINSADKNRINLMLIPAGDDAKRSRLSDFYGRFGFSDDGDVMRRDYKRASGGTYNIEDADITKAKGGLAMANGGRASIFDAPVRRMAGGGGTFKMKAYEPKGGVNRRTIDVPGVGPVEMFFDEPNKRIVVSDEGYWNPNAPVGEDLDKAVEWAHSKGYKAGVALTPYSSKNVIADMGIQDPSPGATDDQLRAYVDAVDFVVTDPYIDARTLSKETQQVLIDFTKDAGDYANSKGKDTWLYMQAFATPDIPLDNLASFNQKLIDATKDTYSTASFFNAYEFGPAETSGVRQLDTSPFFEYINGPDEAVNSVNPVNSVTPATVNPALTYTPRPAELETAPDTSIAPFTSNPFTSNQFTTESFLPGTFLTPYEMPTSTPSTSVAAPAQSAGYLRSTGEGGYGAQAYYDEINAYLANHGQDEIQQAMLDYGVSQQDVDQAMLSQSMSAAPAFTPGSNDDPNIDLNVLQTMNAGTFAKGGRAMFDDGGIASPEESSGSPPDREQTKASLMAEFLAKAAKDQGKEELSSLKKPRALTDLLNRGVLANNPLSAGVDLFNLGLGAVGMGSEKPFLGSEHLKDLMKEYNVTSGEERPMMETALSFASPTAMIKGGMKATDAAKKAPELMKKASDAFTSSKLSPLATEAKTASAGKPTGATYATKQEGPFFRVSPTTLDVSGAKNRGIREAPELQGQGLNLGTTGQTGREVPQLLSSEEVGRIIANPVANEPLNIAKKYTQETQGVDFAMPNIPESSLAKQSAIGRTQQLAVDGSPEYKTAVFDAYAKQMPDVLEQAGAKNYDDLMEKAYRQLAKETDDQFKILPYNFSYHRAGEGNYNGAMDMASDVHGNKHLYVYQGGDKHDFLNRIDPASGLNENEKFRAVHDLLGHAIYGNQFGPKGEEMAWAVHSQMYSPLARLAMTAETRGQNSMVNYSPLNVKVKSAIAGLDELEMQALRKGDKALVNEIRAAKRQTYADFEFAPNKAVLLPPEFVSPKFTGGMPDYLSAANRPTKGTETQSVLTHFSNDPNLQMLDPKRYGTGIKGAEAERLRDYAGGVRDRSYFYMGEPGTVSPESGLGVNRYRGEASSLYDITQDPLNFQTLARESNRTPFTAKVNQGVTYPLQDANDIERLIKEYGYEGMANPKATKPMAIMFKETPVRRQARGGLTLMK